MHMGKQVEGSVILIGFNLKILLCHIVNLWYCNSILNEYQSHQRATIYTLNGQLQYPRSYWYLKDKRTSLPLNIVLLLCDPNYLPVLSPSLYVRLCSTIFFLHLNRVSTFYQLSIFPMQVNAAYCCLGAFSPHFE